MNPIFTFFKFLYDDTKEDIMTLKKMFTDEKYLREGWDRIILALKQFNFHDFLVTSWPVIIIIVGFFFAGWFLAAKYYEHLANEAIYAVQMKANSFVQFHNYSGFGRLIGP